MRSSPRSTPLKVALTTLALFSALSFALTGHPAQADSIPNLTFPPGFERVAVASGLDLPMDVEFLPSGELLVAEKGQGSGAAGESAIRLVRNGVVQELPALVLSTNTDLDSGIVGIIADPDFEENGYFYVWYATGQNALDWEGRTWLRLSRFTLDLVQGIAVPESELIMLDEVLWSPVHHGGGMEFDEQGNLYLAIGEVYEAHLAQDMSVLNGKVIRIRPTETGYSVPEDNPFVDTEDARPEIYALGLRNPFRMTRRASDGAIFVVDVGGEKWEEINRLSAGANYGWVIREGPCPAHQGQPCEPAPPQFTDPVLYYSDTVRRSAISAVAVYEGHSFPRSYHGRLFFADIVSDYIATGDAGGDAPTDIERFTEEAGGIVDMEYHEHNLYGVSLYEGLVQMIHYDGATNHPPSPRLSATVDDEGERFTATFAIKEVADPDDIVFDYHWDFGDDSASVVTRTSTISHTYEQSGSYTATLRVVDIRGAESEELLVMLSPQGVVPQIESDNLTRPDATLYRNGDTIHYQAVHTGDTSGLDPERPYTWSVELHADSEVITVVQDNVAVSDTLDVDVNAYWGSTDVWYRFLLTVRAGDGGEVIVTRDLHPEIVELTVETWPPSTTVTLNGERVETPFTFDTTVGVTHTLTAPPQVPYRGLQLPFEGWYASDGKLIPSRQWSLVAPPQETTYQARYTYRELFLPDVRRRPTTQTP